MKECANPECLALTDNKYCSCRCMAIVSNKTHTKRKKVDRPPEKMPPKGMRARKLRPCNVCGKTVKGYAHAKCKPPVREVCTLKDAQDRACLNGKHPSWRNSYVRTMGRALNKDLSRSGCQVCGYSTHIEYAHIRPITDFPEDSLLSMVNHPDNMLILCRNHHWEFDHGVLSIDQIPKRKAPAVGIEPTSPV